MAEKKKQEEDEGPDWTFVLLLGAGALGAYWLYTAILKSAVSSWVEKWTDPWRGLKDQEAHFALDKPLALGDYDKPGEGVSTPTATEGLMLAKSTGVLHYFGHFYRANDPTPMGSFIIKLVNGVGRWAYTVHDTSLKEKEGRWFNTGYALLADKLYFFDIRAGCRHFRAVCQGWALPPPVPGATAAYSSHWFINHPATKTKDTTPTTGRASLFRSCAWAERTSFEPQASCYADPLQDNPIKDLRKFAELPGGTDLSWLPSSTYPAVFSPKECTSLKPPGGADINVAEMLVIVRGGIPTSLLKWYIPPGMEWMVDNSKTIDLTTVVTADK